MTKYLCFNTNRLVFGSKKNGCPFCAEDDWLGGSEPHSVCLWSIKKHKIDITGKKHGDYIELYPDMWRRS